MTFTCLETGMKAVCKQAVYVYFVCDINVASLHF